MTKMGWVDPRGTVLHATGESSSRHRLDSANPKSLTTSWNLDVLHDLFGHVPLLFNPVFADFVQRYGQGGLKAHEQGMCEQLSRLYWYTIERD